MDLDTINNDLRAMICGYGLEYVDIPDKEDAVAIYNLFRKQNIPIVSLDTSAIFLFYLAFYYYSIEEEVELAKIYYKMAIDKDFVPAINNLAYLYHRERDFILAEKYYLMAIEKNCKMAVFNLAMMYDRLYKRELAIKYYLQDLSESIDYNNSCKRLNYLLNKYGDISFFIQAKPYLSASNQKKLNKILTFIQDFKHGNFNSRLMEDMDCTSCKMTRVVVFLHCGHPLCTKCFHNGNKCGMCLHDKNTPNHKKLDNPVNQEKNIPKTELEMIKQVLVNYSLLDMMIPEDDIRRIKRLLYEDIIEYRHSDVYIFFLIFYYITKKQHVTQAMSFCNYLMEKRNTDSTLLTNMAILLEDHDSELSEKIYLMAIEKNNTEAMFRLAKKYYDSSKRKLGKKYFLMAANEYHIAAREWINIYLKSKFNVNLLLQSESFLNENNTEKLNKFLVYVYENHDSDFNKYIADSR